MSASLDKLSRGLAAQLRAGPRALTAQQKPGPGAAFWQFRPYQAGEPAAAIDWRASARSARPVVREREWHAPRRLAVWWEHSPGLSDGTDKARDAAVLARALLYAAGQDLPPLEGGGQGGVAHAGPGVALLCLGDFWALPRSLPPAQHGFVLQVVTPSELTLPHDGPHIFEGPGCSVRLEAPERVREAYRARVDAHCAALADIAARRGWGYAQAVAGDDLLPPARAAWEALALMYV
jgi:hypothetical protein